MQYAGIGNEIFPGGADVDRLESPVSELAQDCLVEGIRSHPLELFGLADFHFAVVDNHIAELLRLSGNHDPVIARKPYFGTEKPAHVE